MRLCRVSLDSHPAGRFNPKLPKIPLTSVQEFQVHKPGDVARVSVTFDRCSMWCRNWSSHPGGDQFVMTAGGPLEPFIRLFPQHKSEFVMGALEEL